MSKHNSNLNLQIIPEEQFNSRIDKIEGTLSELLEFVKHINKASVIPNMLTSDQVMEALNIKRWKFDQLIADGELEYIRKGRKIYVPEASIKQYFGIK
ncbi:helix-turn-helix domain-containing protein [Roseivirga misakiensis]|uniref:Helix-turn-helix domain-containing protein n=1 Tax=Roseivirga misakiensis TaxID=1563681 RepID=A0A1E5T5Q9_9BACT|nr:helix-turn-helix domain-containing protein [Roseivirga misakiensis]OEK06722.1 hypothetical protein BFP71_03405 [Roseivirga misakiensis]